MVRRVVQRNKRDDFVKVPVAVPKNNTQKIVLENKKREKHKFITTAPPDPTLIGKIKSFVSNPNNNYYLGFGGTGDAILLLSSCWNDPKAKVVFFANHIPFMQKFFDLFKIPVFLYPNIMGSNFAGPVFNLITKIPGFRSSAHLADGLNYGDWINEDKYIPRIKSYVPWIEKLGTFKSEEPIFILAPSGSSKDKNRQRYITPEEYNKLIEKNIKLNYTIYSAGSVSDLHYYGLNKNKNTYWLTSDKIYSWDGTSRDINLHQMLQVINSASKVISTDTWLKTYTLLCGINTTVIKTRWNGSYKELGSDITDFIFLNNKIWPFLTLESLENLLV
jgi:hypothetical protein